MMDFKLITSTMTPGLHQMATSSRNGVLLFDEFDDATLRPIHTADTDATKLSSYFAAV